MTTPVKRGIRLFSKSLFLSMGCLCYLGDDNENGRCAVPTYNLHHNILGPSARLFLVIIDTIHRGIPNKPSGRIYYSPDHSEIDSVAVPHSKIYILNYFVRPLRSLTREGCNLRLEVGLYCHSPLITIG
jgi:hypothetical protein